MNCYYHAEVPAVAFCRSCGRPVCQACQKLEGGTVFCPEHAPLNTAAPPAGDPGNPYAQTDVPNAAPRIQTSPALAFILGFIPGVGAIYNGQYIKGLVHAVIFGIIVSMLSSNETNSAAPLLGILLAAFIFYMPFEAFHTARKRQAGIAVDEWSSLASAPAGGVAGSPPARNSAGPVILIGIGVLFLLDNLNIVEFRHIGRFWPVLLIAGGAYMLYSRTTGNRSTLGSGGFPNGGGPAYRSAPYPATSYGGPPPADAPQSRPDLRKEDLRNE